MADPQDREVVAVIHLQVPDGVLDLPICWGDDVLDLAAAFVEQYGLPLEATNALASVMRKSKTDGMRKKWGPNWKDYVSTPHLEDVPKEIFADALDPVSPGSPLSCFDRSPSPKQSRTLRSGNNMSSLHIETSPSTRESASKWNEDDLKNQSVYDRLYSSAEKYRQRRKVLHNKVHDERYQKVLASSFRAHHPRDDDEDYYLDESSFPDSGSARRRSLSVSSLRRDPQVFSRLYNDAERYRNKKEDLRSSLNRSRSVDILSTSVRSMDTTKTTVAMADQMYRDIVDQRADRELRLAALADSLQREREAEMERELTFSPHISTSRHMALPRSPSPEHCFNDLYGRKEVHEREMNRLRNQVQKELDKQAYFVPKICDKSRALAQRRLERRAHDRVRRSNDGQEDVDEPTSDPHCEAELPADQSQTEPSNDVVDHVDPMAEEELGDDVLKLLRGAWQKSDLEIETSRHMVEPSDEAQTPVPAKHFVPLFSPTTVRSPDGRRILSRSPSVVSAVDVHQESVFDRLYNAKEEREQIRLNLVETLGPHFSHTPDTSKSRKSLGKSDTVEADPSQQLSAGKTVFERLYSLSVEQKQSVATAIIEQHKEEVNEGSFVRHEYTGYQSPARRSAMTLPQAHLVVERLYRSQAETNKKRTEKLEKESEKRKANTRTKSHCPRNAQIANQKHIAALGEIFDVLRLAANALASRCSNNTDNTETAQLFSDKRECSNRQLRWQRSIQDGPLQMKELQNSAEGESQVESKDNTSSNDAASNSEDPEQTESFPVEQLGNDELRCEENPVNEMHANEERHESRLDASDNTQLENTLDLQLASAAFLQPKELAYGIDKVLQSLRKRAGSASAMHIHKEDFVEAVLQHMFSGLIPPLGAVLLQPQRNKNQREVLTSEERAAKECTGAPQLRAGTITNRLVEERHRRRRAGVERIEDSLIASGRDCEHKIESIREQVTSERMQECTFQPALIANTMRQLSYSSRLRKSAQFSPQRQFNATHGTALQSHTAELAEHVNANREGQVRSGYLVPPFLQSS